MVKVTKQQIEEWKKQHGKVWELTVGDKIAYVRSPSRKEISASGTIAQSDPLQSNEFLLNACWLGGDNDILEDDSYFLGAVAQLEEIVDIKKGSIKKL